MSDASWAITSTKRRRTTGTPTSRKRAKPDHDDRGIRRRQSDQQATLTQIDFVKSSSFEKEDDAFFEPVGASETYSRVPKRQRLKKRDSTLTQMDFFDQNQNVELETDECVSLMEAPRSSMRPSIPSFDGPNSDSPVTSSKGKQDTSRNRSGPFEFSRVPRPASARRETKNMRSLQHGTPRDLIATASQEGHQPRKRKKTDKRLTNNTGNRRRSGRIAAANKAESKDFAVTTHRDVQAPIRPLLEIQDSTDFATQPTESSLLQSMSVRPPVTPSKTRNSIPSSQSPESLASSTRNNARYSHRTPLGEMSTNVRFTPTKLTVLKAGSKNTFKPSKICVLKIPPTALVTLPSRVDDVQHDIWSLQATSSPGKGKCSSPKQIPSPKKTASAYQCRHGTGGDQDATNVGDLISTGVDTQTSLPDAYEIVAKHSQGDRISTALAKKTTFGNHIVNMIPELDRSCDEGSDLGSPVTNDTQFNNGLEQRTSSPTRANQGSTQRQSAPIVLPDLPAPRLVNASPNGTTPCQTMSLTFHDLSSSFGQARSQSLSFNNVIITRVPLNDIVEHQQLSSSPALPPTRNPNLRSVHPALLPHSSQVSTQAPSTQGYFLPSSAPQSFLVPIGTEVERITIKDSSSVSARLSHVQQHEVNHDSSDNDDEIRLIDGSQDEGDLDLDPSTLQACHDARQDNVQTAGSDDVTQTPTQKSRPFNRLKRKLSSTDESPVVTKFTTRAQRDAELDIIALASSSPPQGQASVVDSHIPEAESIQALCRYPSARTGRDPKECDATSQEPEVQLMNEPSSPMTSLSSLPYSPSPPRVLMRKYTPIPGFDNDTQSDFTQNGHVTAAYIHHLRDEGVLPQGYTPKPYKVKNWKPSMYDGGRQREDKGGSTIV